MLREDAILRNNAIFVTGTIGAGVLGYAFHFVTGRLLGPGSYAVVASAVAALYLLTLPVIGIQMATARFTSLAAARGDAAGTRQVLGRITTFIALAGLPVLGVLVVLAPDVARYLNIADTRIILSLGLATYVTALVTVNRGALQGHRRFAALSFNMVIDTASRVVVAAGLVIGGLGSLGAVAALFVGPAIAYGQSLLMLGGLRRPSASDTKVEGVGRYAVLAVATGVGINFMLSIDTLLAKHYLDATSAGLYAAAAVLARVVYFLGLSVTGVMFPEVASLHARNQAHFHVVDRSLAAIALVGGAMVLAYLVAPGLALLPFGPSFEPVGRYLGLFGLAATMLTLANLLITYFLSIARSTFLVPLLAACVLETLLLLIFHADIVQFLSVILTTFGLLSVTMGVLYARDRWAHAR